LPWTLLHACRRRSSAWLGAPERRSAHRDRPLGWRQPSCGGCSSGRSATSVRAAGYAAPRPLPFS